VRPMLVPRSAADDQYVDFIGRLSELDDVLYCSDGSEI